MVQSFREPTHGTNPAIKLTEREEEILPLLSIGYANKENADKMSISMSTVRTRLRHIYEKLHARSRTEAVLKFLKQAGRRQFLFRNLKASRHPSGRLIVPPPIGWYLWKTVFSSGAV